jgi:hypothetical protein
MVASHSLCWGRRKDSSSARRLRGKSRGGPRRRVVRCTHRKRPRETSSGRRVRARREGGVEGSAAREREGERSIGPVEKVEGGLAAFLAEAEAEEEEGALRFWFLVSLSCFPLALPLPLPLLVLVLVLVAFLPCWAVAVIVVFVFFALLSATALPPLFLALGMAPSYS